MPQQIHMNAGVGNPMNKQDSFSIIGFVVGAAIDIISNYPKTVTQWCYRILCGVLAGFILAPFLIHLCRWLSSHYLSIFGWANPDSNFAVVPMIYTISVLCAEPFATFIRRNAKNDFFGFLSRKLGNGSYTKKNTQSRGN